MLRLRPRKGRVGTVGHVGGHRLFVQQVQHTVGAGKHLGQAGTEVGQCHHRAKGAQSRQGADEHPFLAHLPVPVQLQAHSQHRDDREQDQGVGDGHGQALAVFQGLLLLAQCLAVGRDAGRTGGGVLILQGIAQAAQALQHIAVGVGQGLPVLPGHLVTALCAPHRQGHAHQQVPGQQHQRGQDVVTGHKTGHADDTDAGDADGRDGVGIEHFQRLDVGGDQGDQVAAVTALQLGRGQAAQRAEHLIPDEGQQLEGDRVVGSLLCVAKHAAQQGKHQDAGIGNAHRAQRAGQPQRPQDAKAAENGDEGGAEVPRHAHDDGRQHDGQHGLDQHDEAAHKDKGAAMLGFVHIRHPPFPAFPAASGPCTDGCRRPAFSAVPRGCPALRCGPCPAHRCSRCPPRWPAGGRSGSPFCGPPNSGWLP